MDPMKTSCGMLQRSDVVNDTTAPLLGGFVTGCAITLALFGMLGKLGKD